MKGFLFANFIFILLLFSFVFADKRLEYIFYYDYFKPKESYGNYKTYAIRYFDRISEKQTNFFELYFHNPPNNKEGNVFVTGVYKDWSERLFSYSSISFGTKADYLPKFRIDHEFFYKTGKNKELLLSIGAYYIRYYNKYQDFTFSYGIVYYSNGWNFTYKKLESNINPGSTRSYTDIYSLGLGFEKKYWLYLTYNYGNQSYISNFYSIPFRFDSKFSFYQLNYRTWIRNNKGIIVEYNKLNLKNSYYKNGFMVGVFYEF